MAAPAPAKDSAYPPRLHNDVYPYIYPSKFKGSLKDKVAIITGEQPSRHDCVALN